MQSAQEDPPTLGTLAAQFVVPEHWTVIPGARLAGGWFGPIETALAVLAPGPGHDSAHPSATPSVHLAQLVVFVLASDEAEARQRVAASVQVAAAADIPEAWLIDRTRGWTEVYRAPLDGTYRARSLCYPGESIHPLALPRAPISPLAGKRARSAR